MKHCILTFLIFISAASRLVRSQLSEEDEVIPGQYIVYYADDADRISTNERLFFAPTSAVASSESFQVVRELKHAIVVAGISDDHYEVLKDDKNIEKVIQDSIIHVNAVQTSPPSWGLDRIDQASLPLDDSYEYIYDGTGVEVYVIDSGIRGSHSEFGGRVVACQNFVPDEACEDLFGHGTHVAGTVGGATSGVAKNVNLIAVKVFDAQGVGLRSTVLAGIEYVIDQKTNNPNVPMVINMSLGGRRLFSDSKEIDDALALDIVVVVAAGNEARNSCRVAPAYVPGAITVGATFWSDRVATFSNFGTCVDIFAPGVSIRSASPFDDVSTLSFSGTSMACPHVAGAAALYLQANPAWTPDQVWNAMRDDAVDVVYFGKRILPLRKIARFFRNRKTTGLLLQVQNI